MCEVKKCIWKEKVIISFTSVVSIELYAGLISVGAFPKLESYLSHYYLFYPLCPESCLSHYYPISPLHPNQPSLCFEESAPFVFYPRHVVSDKSPKWFDTRNTISGHFRVLLIRKKTWFFDGLQNQVFSVVFSSFSFSTEFQAAVKFTGRKPKACIDYGWFPGLARLRVDTGRLRTQDRTKYTLVFCRENAMHARKSRLMKMISAANTKQVPRHGRNQILRPCQFKHPSKEGKNTEVKKPMASLFSP